MVVKTDYYNSLVEDRYLILMILKNLPWRSKGKIVFNDPMIRHFITTFLISNNYSRMLTWKNSESSQNHTIFCIHISNTRLFTGSSDGAIRVFNLESNAFIKEIRPTKQDSLLSRDVYCLATHRDKLYCGGFAQSISVFRLDNYEELTGLAREHSRWISTLLFREDLLNPRLDILLSASADGTVIVWDADKPICEMRCRIHAHTAPVSCLALYGDLLLTGSYDKTIGVWELCNDRGRSADKIGALMPEQNMPQRRLVGHLTKINCMALSGHILFSGSIWIPFTNQTCTSNDTTIRVWDILTGICLSLLPGYPMGVYCMSLLSDPTSSPESQTSNCSKDRLLVGSDEPRLVVQRCSSPYNVIAEVHGYAFGTGSIRWHQNKLYTANGNSITMTICR